MTIKYLFLEGIIFKNKNRSIGTGPAIYVAS